MKKLSFILFFLFFLLKHIDNMQNEKQNETKNQLAIDFVNLDSDFSMLYNKGVDFLYR